MNWISVKDRVPDNTDDVLVNIKDLNGFEFQQVTYFENGCWSDKHGGCYSYVSHWMPLKPPKD